MAVAIRTEFPAGAGTEMYDAVSVVLDLDNDPADGLLFHWAGDVDGKWTVTDVWESRPAYERFLGERLLPAIQSVPGAQPDGPQPEIAEFAVHNFVER
jgi:hypothetical protein